MNKKGRVVTKLMSTVIGLYAGGLMLTQLGIVMANTSSAFYSGLSLIGWSIGTVAQNATEGCHNACGTASAGVCYGTVPTCIRATSGTGILSVIGIVAVASIILEFVEVRM